MSHSYHHHHTEKKSTKKILMAFLLNSAFSIFEFIGGMLTGSVAIVSDAVHDLGDALSIGVAFFLERKAQKRPDANYTYGYARYSILGAVITTAILIAGSLFVISRGVMRFFSPAEVNYDGMIVFAVFGVVINFLAAYFTRDGEGVNQKSVNLHMLEDVLGWVVVLVGSILMKFTDIAMIDALMSIGIALFILYHATNNLHEILDLFLEKTPDGISVDEVEQTLRTVDGVVSSHHLHIWSMDGVHNLATMHLVIKREIAKNPEKAAKLKSNVRQKLAAKQLSHITIELESEGDHCAEEHCEG